MKGRYPKVIEGDLMHDNFFDANPEVAYYSEMKSLIDDYTRSVASKIMWSFFILKDMRSFYYDKKTYDERKAFVISNYYPEIEFSELKHIEEFYEDKILINEDVLQFNLLNMKFERNIVSNDKFTAQMASKEKEALIIFKQKAYGVMNDLEILRIQGRIQPGLLARTKIYSEKKEETVEKTAPDKLRKFYEDSE